ncbi:hypothetical protein EDC04DRAFT_2779247, partial [Pisolithus marmoratus]
MHFRTFLCLGQLLFHGLDSLQKAHIRGRSPLGCPAYDQFQQAVIYNIANPVYTHTWKIVISDCSSYTGAKL